MQYVMDTNRLGVDKAHYSKPGMVIEVQWQGEGPHLVVLYPPGQFKQAVEGVSWGAFTGQ